MYNNELPRLLGECIDHRPTRVERRETVDARSAQSRSYASMYGERAVTRDCTCDSERTRERIRYLLMASACEKYAAWSLPIRLGPFRHLHFSNFHINTTDQQGYLRKLIYYLGLLIYSPLALPLETSPLPLPSSIEDSPLGTSGGGFSGGACGGNGGGGGGGGRLVSNV